MWWNQGRPNLRGIKIERYPQNCWFERIHYRVNNILILNLDIKSTRQYLSNEIQLKQYQRQEEILEKYSKLKQYMM